MSARSLSMWAAALLCAVACQVFVVSASAGELPDGRVYERVSSLAQYGGEVYTPGASQYYGKEVSTEYTDLPFQASSDGRKVAFVGSPTVGGNELYGQEGGNQYLATSLSAGGWTQSTLSPTDRPQGTFQVFSNDLSVGFLDSQEPLSPLAPGFGGEVPTEGSYDIPYSTNTSGEEYLPLITTTPPFRSTERFRSAGYNSPGKHYGRILTFAGASTDSSHVLFLANDALTGASEGRPAAEGGPGNPFEEENNLYESVNGQLQLVNVLPDGATQANATFGGGATEYYYKTTKFSHVISNDGSRVFWTDLNTGHIYVRENGTSTVEISSAGKYQTASSDGSIAFYTNGDLYKYELEGAKTTDLTPSVPVKEVVGASEDGKYVYYVTTSGEFKSWHDGTTTTIMATEVSRGEVTPDGQSVVFTYAPGEKSQSQVSVYDADTGTVYCASCTASGTLGALPATNEADVYWPRWISADGSHVFFVSSEALVPQDTDGMYDVYEWERPGAGSCSEGESKGCVYLLSEGTSTQDSFFADASENGNDVFIITRAKLVNTDQDELFDLYDVSSDGTTPPVPSECTGSGCQGLPGAPPIFATPSSVTFEGVGNFAAPTKEAKAKPKPKKKPKYKKKTKKRRKSGKGNSKSKAKKSARKASRHERSGSKGGRS